MSDDDLAPLDALIEVSDAKGQRLITADAAWRLLKPFARYVTVEQVRTTVEEVPADAEEVDPHHRAKTLSLKLADQQQPAHEHHALVQAYPHEMVVSYSDVSWVLLDAVGGEPTQANYAGSGFTADATHATNVEKLADHLPDSVTEDVL